MAVIKKIKIWIDEAGRWPWAGPVVACSLAFNSENMPDLSFLKQLGDSKKISIKKRESLYKQLIEMSLGEKPTLYFWIWVVDNFIIDEINIKQANREAMRRSLVEILRKATPHASLEEGLDYKFDVFIDGKDNYSFDELTRKPVFVIGWDGKITEIGAASIIAKVFRDKLMTQYATLYPNFGFDTNQGYGTKKHQSHLQDPSDITGIHRTTYKPVKIVAAKKEKLLLHICCGPDATVPIMDLKKDYEVICFWYDPNIQPRPEHEKRVQAFKKVCEIEDVEYIIWEYDVGNFFKKIKGLEATPERGDKCTKCYDMRLERSALEARKLWIKYWTSTLNTSPHKDLDKMFSLWDKWSITETIHPQTKDSLKQKLDFLKIAFRKNKWFERSVAYTKEHDIYRQNYCGCIYSDTFPGGKEQFLEKLKAPAIPSL